MAITSASTVSQIEDEYIDTLDYRSSPDTALAHRHLIALRAIIAKRPSSGTKGPNTFGYNVQALSDEAKEVRDWLQRFDTGNQSPEEDYILIDFRHNGRQ